MADDAAALVTPDMRDRRGVWGEERVSYPISVSDIRRWAIAVYWPETPPRLFWDEDYARTTRWGGIVAPQDFNPFAWPVVRRTTDGARQPPSGQDGPRRLRVMNGGQTDTYQEPTRPGDVITARSRLRDWEERETRLGHTLFVFNETEWHNQDDRLVKRRLSTAIRY